MAKIKEHLMQLMREIDTVCQEYDLPYALYGRTAGCGIKDGRFTTQCYQFQIMMQAKDILTLKEELSRKYKENRGFEDFSTNPDLAWNVVRYVHTASTIFDKSVPVSYRMPGTAITILPLYTRSVSRVCEGLETWMIYRNGGKVFDERDSSHKAKRVGRYLGLADKAIGLFGKKWAADHIWHSMEKEKGRQAEKGLILRGDPDTVFADLRKRINADYLFKTRRVPFEGLSLPVPEKSDAFFKCLYGEDWQEIAGKPLKSLNSMSVIWDNAVPFKDYLAMFREQGLDIYRIFEEERDLRNYKKNTCESYKELSDRYLYYGRRSVKRIDNYLAYRGKMEELANAEKNQDTARIKKIMNRYLKTVERYRNLGLAFYINDELEHYAELVWKKQKGKKDYGSWVRSNTPDRYKKKDMEAYLKEYI